MTWQIALTLGLATPFIVLPVAFVWWLNIGGVMAAVKRVAGKGAPASERGRA